MYTPKEKNTRPASIGFAENFMGPKGDLGFFMNADYPMAKKIIEWLLSEKRNVQLATMGLSGDWNENNTVVYANGKHFEYDAYECSQWAEPILIVDFDDQPSETYSVWTRSEK